jgi:hypothetical protein
MGPLPLNELSILASSIETFSMTSRFVLNPFGNAQRPQHCVA